MPSADAMLASPDGTILPPTVDDFLSTYCVARSIFASSSGVPDFQRASRIIIKEYAAGKLLYCHAPPSFDDEVFQKETLTTATRNTKKLRGKLRDDHGPAPPVLTDEGPPFGVEKSSHEPEATDGNAELGIEEDDMLLELLDATDLGGAAPTKGEAFTAGSNPNSKPGSRQKRWGKKGRKLRNKDPYGCHSTPDESLAGSEGIVGVTVKSGKKHTSKNDYVRPAGYGAQVFPATTNCE
jgi:hypothetical protein